VPIGQLSHMADVSSMIYTQTHISELSETHAEVMAPIMHKK